MSPPPPVGTPEQKDSQSSKASTTSEEAKASEAKNDGTKLVITTAGRVTPDKAVKEVTIEADGVILENANLDKLIISDKLGEGTATINGVTAKAAEVLGGGKNSVHFNGCQIGTIKAKRKKEIVHIILDESTAANKFSLASNTILTILGSVKNIVAEKDSTGSIVEIKKDANVNAILANAVIDIVIDASVTTLEFTGDATGSKVAVSKDATVATLATDVKVNITGDGKIEKVVTTDKANIVSTIKPDTTTVSKTPFDTTNTTTPVVKKKKPDASTPTPEPTPEPEPEATPAPAIDYTIDFGNNGVHYLEEGKAGNSYNYMVSLINVKFVVSPSDKAFVTNQIKLVVKNKAGKLLFNAVQTVKTSGKGGTESVNFIFPLRDIGDAIAMSAEDLAKAVNSNDNRLAKDTEFTVTLERTQDGTTKTATYGEKLVTSQYVYDKSYYTAQDEDTAAVAAVKAATNNADLKTALTTHASPLKINMADINDLSDIGEAKVLAALLADKASYASAKDISDAFDAAVIAARTKIASTTITPLTQTAENNATVADNFTAAAVLDPVGADGEVVTAYQWYTSKKAFSGESNPAAIIGDTANAAKIDGATSATYKPAATTAAGTAYYFCFITTKGNGTSSAVTDTASVVTKAVLTGTVSVTGGSKFGSTLTASLIDTNSQAVGDDISYQWLSDNVAIADVKAKARFFEVTEAYIGKKISCEITTTDCTGKVTSAQTAVIGKADGKAAPTVVTTAGSKPEDEILLTAGEGKIAVKIGNNLSSKAFEYAISGLEGALTWKDLTAAGIEGLTKGDNVVLVREKASATNGDGVSVSTTVTVLAVKVSVKVFIKLNGENKEVIIPTIKLQKDNETPIEANHTTLCFEAKVDAGEYKILWNDKDTGVIATVTDAAADVTVYTYTVAYSVSDADSKSKDSTIVAKWGDDVLTLTDGEVTVLKGANITFTTTPGVVEGTKSYTYAWTKDANSVSNTTNVHTENNITAATTIACTVTGSDQEPSDFTFNETDKAITYGDTAPTTGFVDNTATGGTGAVTFASSSTGVATIDSSGVLTIAGAGTTTITATKAASTGFAATTKSFTLTVNAKTLTLTTEDFAITDKEYDGNNEAQFTGTIALANKVDSDDVTLTGTATAAFASKDVGDAIAVTLDVTALTLNGAQKDNYILDTSTLPANLTGLTGKITAKELTVDTTKVTATKKYDGTKIANLTGVLEVTTGVGSEALTVTATMTGEYASKDVGNSNAVTVTVKDVALVGETQDNYTVKAITADKFEIANGAITAKDLTISGLTAVDRPYKKDDKSVTITGTGILAGMVDKDDVALGALPAAAMADDVGGTNKPVTFVGDFILTGTDAGNYTVVSPTITVNITKSQADITAKVDTSGDKYTKDMTKGVNELFTFGEGLDTFKITYIMEEDSASMSSLTDKTLTVKKPATFKISATYAADTIYAETKVTATYTVAKGVAPAAPTGMTVIGVTGEGWSDGAIEGLTGEYAFEYKLSTATEYKDVHKNGDISGLAKGTYHVRTKDVGFFEAGKVATVVVGVAELPLGSVVANPVNVYVCGIGKTANITATPKDMYGTPITSHTVTYKWTIAPSVDNTAPSLVLPKLTNETTATVTVGGNGDATVGGYVLTVTATQGEIIREATVSVCVETPFAEPEGLKSINASGPAAKDGIITGLNSSNFYQYKLSTDANYTDVSVGSSEITGLGKGIYHVRQVSAENEGLPATVEVKETAPDTTLDSIVLSKGGSSFTLLEVGANVTAFPKNKSGELIATEAFITYTWTIDSTDAAVYANLPTLTNADTPTVTVGGYAAADKGGIYRLTVTVTQGEIKKEAEIAVNVTK